MKHPSTQAFYAYWDQQRGDAQAPERSAMAPDPVRHLLGDTFVLSCDIRAGFPVRVAGTRVCALMGRDLKGHSFASFWNNESRGDIEDLLEITREEGLATIAGVTAPTANGSPFYLELLLLPFAPRVHTLESIFGMLAPLTAPMLPADETLNNLALTTWRHAGHRPSTIRQRAIRRLALAKGFVVYEGLRG